MPKLDKKERLILDKVAQGINKLPYDEQYEELSNILSQKYDADPSFDRKLLGHLLLEKYNIDDTSKNPALQVLQKSSPEIYTETPIILGKEHPDSIVRALKSQAAKKLDPKYLDEVNLFLKENELGRAITHQVNEKDIPHSMFINPKKIRNPLEATSILDHEKQHMLEDIKHTDNPKYLSKEIDFKKPYQTFSSGHHFDYPQNYEMEKALDVIQGSPERTKLSSEMLKKWKDNLGKLNIGGKLRQAAPFLGPAALGSALYSGDTEAAIDAGVGMADPLGIWAESVGNAELPPEEEQNKQEFNTRLKALQRLKGMSNGN